MRLAAKNINEVEKMLITPMTLRGPFHPQLGWWFIAAQQLHAERKREVKTGVRNFLIRRTYFFRPSIIFMSILKANICHQFQV